MITVSDKLTLNIEGLGPFSEKLIIELDTPLTVLVGDTGTGKSFLLRLFSVLLKNLKTALDARALENDLTSEFRHPRFAVHEEAEMGRVSLSYGDEKLADVKVYSKPFATHGMHSDYIKVEKWKGSQPYIELAEHSVIAPDVRVPLIRDLLSGDHSSSPPSASAFTTIFSDMRSKEHWLLEEMLIPMVEEGLLPRRQSYFKEAWWRATRRVTFPPLRSRSSHWRQWCSGFMRVGPSSPPWIPLSSISPRYFRRLWL